MDGQEHDAGNGRQGGVTRLAFAGAALLVLGVVVTAGWKSAGELESARLQEERLESRIAEARVRIRDLEARVARLDDDPATLERLAREELGMVRPGDVVIVLPDDPLEEHDDRNVPPDRDLPSPLPPR